MTPSDEHPPHDEPELPLRSIPLDDDRTLVLRIGGPDDVAAMRSLYERLDEPDLQRRFFSGHVPPDQAIERWLAIGERGGLVLVAEVVEGGSTTVIAEGGYAVLDDGDGELGITVDPSWRGWVGPWLLDAIASEAANRGVANLQAEVLLANRPMRAVLQHRGYAAVDHPDWQHIRIVVSTTGPMPSWPDTSDPHLLVAASGARWSGEGAAQQLGFDVRTCPGPTGPRPRCPALRGEPCPLVEGADALIFALPSDDPRSEEILAETRRHHPELPVVIAGRRGDDEGPPCLTAAELLAQVQAALNDDA